MNQLLTYVVFITLKHMYTQKTNPLITVPNTLWYISMKKWC